MNRRVVNLYAFASVKGGVGKSTLAVAGAKAFARAGRTVAVVDCDLLGTSLADGLSLRAPTAALQAPNGAMVRLPELDRFFTVTQTETLRLERRAEATGMERRLPVYLNDLLEMGSEAPFSTWAWRHPQEDDVLYFPSSSLYADVTQSLAWLYDEPFQWVGHLALILDRLIDELPLLSDILLDLPPGVIGFSHEALALFSQLLRGQPLPAGYPRWPRTDIELRPKPFLVATLDRNDLLPALELVGRHLEKLPTLLPLVNRAGGAWPSTLAAAQATKSRSAALESVRSVLGPLGVAAGLFEKLRAVSYHEELSQIFQAGDIALGSWESDVLSALRPEVES